MEYNYNGVKSAYSPEKLVQIRKDLMRKVEVLEGEVAELHTEATRAIREVERLQNNELRPATRFLRNTPEKQMTHVISEIHEIQDAMNAVKYPKMDGNLDKKREHLLDEIIDAQTALATLAATYGASEEEIREARRRVIAKNQVRGYYEEATT